MIMLRVIFNPVPTDVVVEFDPVRYSVVEGKDVMFRIVKRTVSTREVTVFFITSPEAGNGM